MSILSAVQAFGECFGRTTAVDSQTWRYYRLGQGSPILWLAGGLRRAAFGFAFMERLARRHTIVAPDYLPVRSADEYFAAFDAILRTEGIERTAVAGQSYGGLLAQAYTAHRPTVVERLILSSTGPVGYGRAWLPIEFLLLALVRILPERAIKRMFVDGLQKAISVPGAERAEWISALNVILMDELSRDDVISHFAVAAEMISKGTDLRSALSNWTGRVVVLRAENDPTQDRSDLPKYEALFGRAVEVIEMGPNGHTAALGDPDAYAGWLEAAMS